MTSFEDSHYILLFRYIMAQNLYSGFAIQNTFTSTVVFVTYFTYFILHLLHVSEVLQRHYLLSAILLTSLSIFAHLPTLIIDIKYVFNEDTAGVLGNT